MKLVIAGATGGVGRQLVRQALERGHEVTALVRDPAKVPAGARPIAIAFDRPDPAGLAEVLARADADAVISAIGPRTAHDAGIAARATAVVVDAMARARVDRLLVVSAAPIGTVPSRARPAPPARDPGDSWVVARVLAPFFKWVFRRQYADLAEMEDVVRASDLAWTILRPPRLVERPLTGVYRTADGRNLRGGMKVARADLAHCLLDSIDRPDVIRRTLGIAY